MNRNPYYELNNDERVHPWWSDNWYTLGSLHNESVLSEEFRDIIFDNVIESYCNHNNLPTKYILRSQRRWKVIYYFIDHLKDDLQQ